jgi:hypothetical protein
VGRPMGRRAGGRGRRRSAVSRGGRHGPRGAGRCARRCGRRRSAAGLGRGRVDHRLKPPGRVDSRLEGRRAGAGGGVAPAPSQRLLERDRPQREEQRRNDEHSNQWAGNGAHGQRIDSLAANMKPATWPSYVRLGRRWGREPGQRGRSPSSRSCAASTGAGAPVSGSRPLAALGNAITSRIESRPAIAATSRSSPRAIPPWGGAP